MGQKTGFKWVNMKGLDYFFYPKKVGVIGASEKENKIGHVIMKNMIKAGYKGKLIPVNPKAKKVLGNLSNNPTISFPDISASIKYLLTP